MKKRIKKVAIIGSGTMGSGIAAQLANAGIKSYLLDIVPKDFTEADKEKNWTMETHAFRNKIVEENKQKLIGGRGLMNKEDAELITVGNTEDNLEWLSECDWIVEVVPEKMEIKVDILNKIKPYIKPGTIVTSNTSGISINKIAEDMPLEFRQYWMGTHFFNPVRLMKLLEIIPAKETLPEVVEFMADFGERILGKGIVYCKDTPNFIANRIGVFVSTSFIKKTDEFKLGIEEVDAIAGPAMGRPKTAVYGMLDMVGLDISLASGLTCYNNVSGDEKELFDRPGWFKGMAARGILGNKTGGGFYKKIDNKKMVIDVNTYEYRPLKEINFPSVSAALKEKNFTKKMQIFFDGDDMASEFVWRQQRDTLLYAASKIPEISDDILNIDRAMRWGYNFAAGPFEMWNGLDLPKYIARAEADGCAVPAWLKEMLNAGITAFYKTEAGVEYYYSIPNKEYVPIINKPEIITFAELEAQNKIVKTDRDGTIYDIGDGVICLVFDSKISGLNPESVKLIQNAQEELDKNWEGMVITGAGNNFSAGNDLVWLMEQISVENWDAIDQALKDIQNTIMANKYSEKPIVVAPFRKTFGNICEMAMQSASIQANGETNFGLLDIESGLIPAAGGIKELVLRARERIKGTSASLTDFVSPYLNSLYTAKKSSSGKDAVDFGYTKPTDKVTLNKDYLVTDAKQRVLALLDEGYRAPVSKSFAAPGTDFAEKLKNETKNMIGTGKKVQITEYDWVIICKVIDVMAAGTNEQTFLDLEREAFISLCKEPKTQERIVNMIKTGKALHN